MFAIESGIEIPETNAGRKTRYHWDQMVPGDSVLIGEELVNSARASLTHFKRNSGHQFVTRQQEDGNIRVWRLA